MRIRQKPVVSAVAHSPAPPVRHHPHARKRPDAFEDDPAWHEHMENGLRTDQHAGKRPDPKMTSKGGVSELKNAEALQLGRGVVSRFLLDDPGDPSVRIERTDVDAGESSPETRAAHDQRTLVHGLATLVLNGVRQPVANGDVVLLPKGTRYQFEAQSPLKLWSVQTPSEEAPMQNSPGVLSEDPSKEFFVGEGVHVLERENSPKDPSVGFDRIRVPAGVTTALHKLKIDERYMITSGQGTVEIDGQKRHVQEGDVVLFPRESTQRITPEAGGMEFYSVTTPRFLVEDFEKPLADAFIDPKAFEGSAAELAALEAKIRST
jgi:mannose-6-phosphate isomerase-like protein (cupin superfamily)